MWRLGVIAVLFAGMLPAETVLIVAHRGASAHAPENTLEAFALAWEQGADAVEGDFRLSADGEVVCIHDATTESVAGTALEVGETSFAGLRALDVSRHFGRGYADLRIPTLAEVIEAAPEGRTIYVELKTGPEIVRPALEIARKSGREDLEIFWIAFDAEVIAEIERLDGGARTGLLVNFKRSGLGLAPSYEDVFRLADSCGADELCVKAHPLLSLRFGELAAARGYRFHVWTVDAPGWAAEMVRRGAASVTTNVPDRMRVALKEGGDP